jgi:hypothetical protein
MSFEEPTLSLLARPQVMAWVMNEWIGGSVLLYSVVH